MNIVNIMKHYLGKEYSKNYLTNYCLYLMKSEKRYDEILAKKESMTKEEWILAEREWRKKNELSCLYYDGDNKADCLIDMWQVIEGVANFINREKGVEFVGRNEDRKRFYSFLGLLMKEGETYLPPENELVKLLFRILELAEQKCNVFLCPSEEMKEERKKFYSQIPVMLYHVFERENLGRFFEKEEEIVGWINSENLSHGFADYRISQDKIRPYILGLAPEDARELVSEEELRQSLEYLIWFLNFRRDLFEILDSRKITPKFFFELGKELISFKKKDEDAPIFSGKNQYPHDNK